jgi:polyisoprenoid-binding protein YceI
MSTEVWSRPPVNALARYALVPASSHLEIESRTTLHNITGKALGITGTIEAAFDGHQLLLDPAPQMKIEVLVENLTSGNAEQDSEMKKFLGSRTHPIIAAELREARQDGRDKYLVKGAITIRGKTGEHDGAVVIHHRGKRLEITGSEMIYLRKFGLEPPKIFVFQVNAYVRVSLHLVAELQG